MLGSHVVVKAFNGEKDSCDIFAEQNELLYKSAWKANFLSGLMMPITQFIGNLAYVAICILGGYYTITGIMTIGGIQSFIQYVRSFTQPITQIANISNVLQQTAAASERVFAFLAQTEETPEVANALSVNNSDDIQDTNELVHIEGNVNFTDVQFAYNNDRIIINEFYCSSEKRSEDRNCRTNRCWQKPRSFKLLMRFYDVNKGEITVDGHDIKLFKRDELRSLFWNGLTRYMVV